MTVLLNVDVPDLGRAIAFYTTAFDLTVSRRFGEGAAELLGWPVPLYLLEWPGGSIGAGLDPRRYSRHWTPVHLDIIVEDVESALRRVVDTGAVQETPIRNEKWGRIVGLADPFGHGLCLIEFVGRGYDEIAN